MSADELYALIQRNEAPAVVDVRSRAEFDGGHVPGAVHLPFWAMMARADAIPGDRNAPVVLYCGHGPRAHAAGFALRRRGFSDVRYLEGHMSEWRRRGLPVEVNQTK